MKLEFMEAPEHCGQPAEVKATTGSHGDIVFQCNECRKWVYKNKKDLEADQQ